MPYCIDGDSAKAFGILSLVPWCYSDIRVSCRLSVWISSILPIEIIRRHYGSAFRQYSQSDVSCLASLINDNSDMEYPFNASSCYVMKG